MMRSSAPLKALPSFATIFGFDVAQDLSMLPESAQLCITGATKIRPDAWVCIYKNYGRYWQAKTLLAGVCNQIVYAYRPNPASRTPPLTRTVADLVSRPQRTLRI